MGLGFPFFPVHKAEYPSSQLSVGPPLDQIPNTQNCLKDRSQHLAHSKPINRSIATGCHVTGKIPGTFGVEVRVLREKREASRAFIYIMDESRLVKVATYTIKYIKFWHRVDCTSNAQCSGLGKWGVIPPFFSWNIALSCHCTDTFSALPPDTGKRVCSEF